MIIQTLTKKEVQDLNKANMNDLIRACLGTLLVNTKK